MDALLLQLSYAAMLGNVEDLAAALAAGAEVDGLFQGTTALMRCCLDGRTKCVELLINAMANVNQVHYYSNPLDYACSRRHPACVKLLLAAGADACVAHPSTGQTVLHRSIEHHDYCVVPLLVEAAPQVLLLEDHNKVTPIEIAIARHYRGVNYQFHRENSHILAYMLDHAPLRPQDAVRLLAHLTAKQYITKAKNYLGAPIYSILTARLPLTASEWALVPSPCPGLGAALPAVLQRSEAEAALLVQHMTDADQRCLRTLALCLGAAQRRGLLPPLPTAIVHRFLADSAEQAALQQIRHCNRDLSVDEATHAHGRLPHGSMIVLADWVA